MNAHALLSLLFSLVAFVFAAVLGE